MKFNPRKIPHKKNPMIDLYNEYQQIPHQKKLIFKDSSTTLAMKVHEYNKLIVRENELREKLKPYLPIKE